MGFFERLRADYKLIGEDGSLDRCSPGYNQLQREVIDAHILAHRASYPESTKTDDELSMAYIFPDGADDIKFSDDYRKILTDIFHAPNSALVQRCETDWEHEMNECLYLHWAERGFSCPLFYNLDLKDHFIAGRVIYNRLLELEEVQDRLHLPGIEDKVIDIPHKCSLSHKVA